MFLKVLQLLSVKFTVSFRTSRLKFEFITHFLDSRLLKKTGFKIYDNWRSFKTNHLLIKNNTEKSKTSDENNINLYTVHLWKKYLINQICPYMNISVKSHNALIWIFFQFCSYVYINIIKILNKILLTFFIWMLTSATFILQR